MRIFDSHIIEVRDFLSRKNKEGTLRSFSSDQSRVWPEAGPRDIVLLPDLAMELGHPDDASLCFTVWTEDESMVKDETISLIGPDIVETDSDRLPFGKIVLARMEHCDEETAYERYRSMELARFSLCLKGYMLRATSQTMREWSRLSKEAVSGGFSLKILGSELIRDLKKIEGIAAAEVIFITQSVEDVMELKETALHATRITQAMNRMMTELLEDCGSCEYQDVCNDASEMKALRETLAKRKAG